MLHTSRHPKTRMSPPPSLSPSMLLPRSRKGVKLAIFIVCALIVFFGFPQTFSRPFPKQRERDRERERFHNNTRGSSALFQKPLDPEETITRRPALGKHRFRVDGLVEVNEDGAHPIFELISRAEAEWAKKHERASKTLEAAVEEYRRRYKRAPPKGFDLWWNYAKEHDVQLPDEYDQIYNDLEPFWGIEPSDLIKIHEENEVKKDSYTLGKVEGGGVEVLTYAFAEGKYKELIVGSKGIIQLFKMFEEHLPPFRLTMYPHDVPTRMSDYEIKAATLEAAASQTYLERSALPKVTSTGWTSACAPNSLARRKTINLDSPPPRPSKKTFIWDHVQSMDPCNHPDHFYHHGQFLSHNMGPGPQHVMVPEFAYCSTMIHHNIRMPVPYGWMEDIEPRSDDPEWDDRLDERLVWRGSNTGMTYSKTSRWKHSHRSFLVEHTNSLEGTLKILPTNRTRNEKLGPPRELRTSRINPAIMDVAFGGIPIYCSPDICDILEQKYAWRDKQSVRQAGNYKYAIDVDGNGWSGRFKRLITSNSLVFKSTIYPEWYADRVAPWVHYIPIQIDLSDLHDALIFFRGDGNGEGAHENLGRKIALAGRQWSKTYWRKEDLAAYLFRLTLEYSRLMSLDREAMSYSEKP